MAKPTIPSTTVNPMDAVVTTLETYLATAKVGMAKGDVSAARKAIAIDSDLLSVRRIQKRLADGFYGSDA